MNRADFGRLIATLRREHQDENGGPWTQAQLAEEANRAAGVELFTGHVIGSIERGARGPDSRTLTSLATALELTSGERREFFLAACGVDARKMTREDNDPHLVRSQLISRMSEIRLPSYIIDPYHDIVAVSWAVIELLELASRGLVPGIQEGNQFPHNMVRFVFRHTDQDDGHLHRMAGDNWPDNLFQTMAMFRSISLRYRSTEYFQALLQELRKCRQFARYWHAVHLDDRDHFVESRKFHYQSEKWGPLAYFFWHHTALTSAGELYLSVYVPASRETALTFAQIAKQTCNLPPICLPTWPEKRLL